MKHENSNNFRLNHNDVYLNLYYQQSFILIIQLAKIFSESTNQKRNIKKLCNRYTNEKLDEDISGLLDANSKKKNDVFRSRGDIIIEVKIILEEIKKLENIIEKVIDLRDTVFAHTDPTSSQHIMELKELSDLTSLANRIYNSLFGKVFDEYFHFQITKQHDIRSIIEMFKET